MPRTLPIVAVVGLPNAGKSTLLNKIVGNHQAVTSPVPGTTRDRQYVDTVWNGIPFTLLDTAGLVWDTREELEKNIAQQLEIAMMQADAIIWVIDGKTPRGGLDQRTLKKFRSLRTTLFVAVNKLDSAKKAETTLLQFQHIGIKPLFDISALTGRGIGDLLDAVVTKLKSTTNHQETLSDIAVSIVGKPNVGKSSIFNAILQEDRVVVSSIPGTTRTSIDETLTYNGTQYTFIDTAGLKKKIYRQDLPDIYGGFQTFKAIRRSDVCLFIIDASVELTKQDQHIAQEIFTLEKGVVIVANKYDLYEGEEKALRDYISDHFPFLWMSPLFFVSAKTGQGLPQVLDAIKPIIEARKKLVDQTDLDTLLKKRLKINPPKLLRDQKNPKVFGLKQINTNPPVFELFVNHPAAISQQFRKSVHNAIIKELGFWGTPIRLTLHGKDRK